MKLATSRSLSSFDYLCRPLTPAAGHGARLVGTSVVVLWSMVGFSNSARAASQTWSAAPTDANWATAANWSGNAVPGIIPTGNNTNTTDVATFNSAITTYGGSLNPVLIDAGRMIGSIVFDTASAGSYVIGGAGSGTLMVGNNLNVTVNATVVNPQTFNAPLAVHLPSSTNGGFTIQNNSTTSTAILTLAGGIVNSPNSTRGTAWTLGGTNTGDNTVSGTINITNSGGIASTITKTGAGKWILSAANTINGGVTISAGTLVAQNATGFGSAGLTINGGVAQIDNGLTLGSSAIALNNTGTLAANNGTGIYNNTITVGAAATGVGLSAVGASDVLSLGNAVANKFTGGQASTVAAISGLGTVFLTGANNYLGSFSINSGTLKLDNATSLGSATTAAVAFGAGSTGKLFLNGVSPTITSLNTNATVGTPIVENNNATPVTLTVSNTAGSSTYGGVLQNGATGTLALAKAGASTLVLSGNSNTYSGGTTISGGTLSVTNTSGSATGTGTISLNSGGTLAGTGIVSGLVTAASGGHLAPGSSAVGTLTLGSLTLAGGSLLDYEFGGGNDLTAISDTNGFTLNGGAFNIYATGTTNPFTTLGTYNVFQYAGTIGGAGLDSSWTTSSASNAHINNPQGGFAYSFGTSGSFVTLTIASNVLANSWNVDADGNWSNASNWTAGSGGVGGVGGGVGNTVHLLNAITTNHTVSVDAAETAGGIELNNTLASYTVGAGGGTLTLNNSGSAAPITVSGTHAISAPLALTSGGATVTVAASSSLTISAPISETATAALTKSGSGDLILTGGTASTYSGGTALNGGSTTFSNLGNLGTGAISFDGGTLKWDTGNTADISSRTVTINSGGATFNTNGNDVTLANPIGNSGTGGLTKSGAGALTMTGLTNTYSGPTTVNGGTIVFDGLSNLGAGTAINIAGGTLKWAGTSTTDISSRTVTIGSGGATFDTNGNDVTFASAIGNSGVGGLTKTGSGKLSLAAGNTYTGANVLGAGTLNIAADTSLGAVPGVAGTNVTIAGGATLQAGAAFTLSANRSIVLSGGIATFDTNGNNLTIAGNISGSGLLNKINAGNLTLTGTNSGTATGGVTLNAGTLFVASQANVPSGTLTLNGTSGITASTTANFSPVVNGTNFLTESASVILGLGNVSGAGTLTFGGSFVNDFTGDMSTFTGTIVSNGGGFRWNGSTGGTNVTFDLVNQGSSVRSNATGITIGAVAGTSSAVLTGSGGGATQNVVYTIGGKTIGVTPVDSTFNGAITNGVGTTGITKVGASILTLNGAGTYTGPTTISAGTLQAGNATALGTSNVTIGGGTLQGTVAGVSIGGNLTLSSGTLDIRDSGTGQFSLASDKAFSMTGGIWLLNITNLATFDSIASLGGTANTFAVGGTLDLTGSTLAAGDYNILTNFTSGSGSFAGITGYDTGAFAVVFNVTGGGTTGTLSITAVPEPSQYGLMLAGMLVVAIAYRRRRVRMV